MHSGCLISAVFHVIIWCWPGEGYVYFSFIYRPQAFSYEDRLVALLWSWVLGSMAPWRLIKVYRYSNHSYKTGTCLYYNLGTSFPTLWTISRIICDNWYDKCLYDLEKGSIYTRSGQMLLLSNIFLSMLVELGCQTHRYKAQHTYLLSDASHMVSFWPDFLGTF